MGTQIALHRGIDVGGRNTAPMAALSTRDREELGEMAGAMTGARA